MEMNEFFKDVRREVYISDFHCLETSGSERRVKINCRMPIGASLSVLGLPEWVLNARELVIAEKAIQRKVICDVEIDGIAVEWFTTPEVKKRTQIFNGAKLKQFFIERTGKDEKSDVYLNFFVYAPSTEEMVIWLYRHRSASSFAQFDITQASFSYEGEDPDESEGENQQLPLVGDDFDAERREALSPEMDEEFKNNKTSKKQAKK